MSSEPQGFLAKSSGVTLDDHTQHLRDQFREHILPAHRFAERKYARFTNGEDLSALTRKAIRWHDIGKKESQWQDACQKDYQEWKTWDDSGRIGKEPRGQCLMKAGLRHEMASLARMLHNEPDVSPIVRVAVAAHHGKLSQEHCKRWHNDGGGAYHKFWKEFNGLSDKIDYTSEWQKALLCRYKFAGPRALLQLADHRASASENTWANRRFLPNFTPFAYTFPAKYGKPRGPQKTVEELWDEPVALLRAATGSGKTDAALLWAKHQIESGRADRLVIAMPTRFTANALAISNASSLSETGLYHSSAWYQRRVHADATTTEQRIEAEQEMARLLETPVTVTTLDHLCISLTATREDHHAVFFNLAHACIVIDEADFYDDFTQANLVILLQALRLLEAPVLLMSATLPESCKTLYDIPRIYEDTTDSTRARCTLKRCKTPAVKPSDIADLLHPAIGGKPTIIYANTVQRAQRYYKYLVHKMSNADDIVLYHSRFTEPDKVEIEERLRSMMGRDAWKTGTQRGVAILTQIGELSVNISADYMISDLCPLDRLVQRIGRLSRFPESSAPGELNLVVPHKKKRDGGTEIYPAPYGTYANGWQPSHALTATDVMLKDGSYSAGDFVRLVNILYAEAPKMSTTARENQRQLRELIGMNWLIQNNQTVAEDAECTNTWRSRDIDFQYTVLTDGKPANIIDSLEEPTLKNWRDWRRLQLKYGVNCYAYEFHKANEDGRLDEITFAIAESGGKNEQKAWFVRPGHYDSTLGLSLKDTEDEEDEDEWANRII